jgi:hypothetical protein
MGPVLVFSFFALELVSLEQAVVPSNIMAAAAKPNTFPLTFIFDPPFL